MIKTTEMNALSHLQIGLLWAPLLEGFGRLDLYIEAGVGSQSRLV